MLPRWHVIWGVVFTGVLYFAAPNISWFYLGLVFFSSFLIDFDHYCASCINRKKVLSLKESFSYHEDVLKRETRDIAKGIKRKGDFHPFHTLEFHALVGLLGIVWFGFFFIFLGMFFHSLLDVVYLAKSEKLHVREFFFFNWLADRV